METRMKVMLVGPEKVGKTAILARFTKGTVPEIYKATEQLTYGEVELTVEVDHLREECTIEILDTPSVSHQRFNVSYYPQTQLFLFVIDLLSFEEQEQKITTLLGPLQEKLEERLRSGQSARPLILVGMKADQLEIGQCDEKSVLAANPKLKAWIDQHHFKEFFVCSQDTIQRLVTDKAKQLVTEEAKRDPLSKRIMEELVDCVRRRRKGSLSVVPSPDLRPSSSKGSSPSIVSRPLSLPPSSRALSRLSSVPRSASAGSPCSASLSLEIPRSGSLVVASSASWPSIRPLFLRLLPEKKSRVAVRGAPGSASPSPGSGSRPLTPVRLSDPEPFSLDGKADGDPRGNIGNEALSSQLHFPLNSSGASTIFFSLTNSSASPANREMPKDASIAGTSSGAGGNAGADPEATTSPADPEIPEDESLIDAYPNLSENENARESTPPVDPEIPKDASTADRPPGENADAAAVKEGTEAVNEGRSFSATPAQDNCASYLFRGTRYVVGGGFFGATVSGVTDVVGAHFGLSFFSMPLSSVLFIGAVAGASLFLFIFLVDLACQSCRMSDPNLGLTSPL